MKKKFLDWAIDIIKKDYPQYDDVKLAELRYGLEGFYLTISKLLVIIPLSILSGNFKYMVILLILFNILRKTGFGIHAKTSLACLISSIIVFIGIPCLCKIMYIPQYVKLLISLIAIIGLFIYAPADTSKRPLINRTRCLKFKYITVINACLIAIASLIIKNNIISNIALMSICLESISVNRLTYKIFNMDFDNYKKYESIKQLA